MSVKDWQGVAAQYALGYLGSKLYNYIYPGSQYGTSRATDQHFNMKGGSYTTVGYRRKLKKRRRGGRGGGILGPPLPRPASFAKESKFARFGSYGQDETFGTLNKPEMVYFGVTAAKATGSGGGTIANSSWSGSIKYHVAAALLRHILKTEFKEDITQHDQRVSGYVDVVGALRFPSICFVSKRQALTGAQPTYPTTYVLPLGPTGTTTAGAMFGDLAKAIAADVLGGAAFGGTADNVAAFTDSLYGYFVFYPDANATVQIASSGIRRLDNQYLKAYSTCEVALQNVTVADATADTSGVRLGDRIDANPLDACIFKFNTPYPKVKHDGLFLRPSGTFSAPGYSILGPMGSTAANDTVQDESWRLSYDANGDGLIIPNAALTRDWRQLPNPSAFEGCIGYTKFKLMPGEIRKGMLKFKFEGTINNFIRGFRTIAEGSDVRLNTKDSFGTSLLFAVEKVMSTGTNTDVTMNYQVSYWAGAYMKRPKKNVIQSYNHTGTQGDNGAVPPVLDDTYDAGTYATGAADA